MSNMTASWRDYYELCKPRVVMLMILTSIVGMCLATATTVPISVLVMGNIGIALAASAAAAVNHVADQHIDKLMGRTKHRPIVQGRLSTKQSLLFALILCIAAMAILMIFTNILTTILTFLSLVGYAVFYTLFLKHATPQNIVIGGLAGAAPPLLGWTAVSNHITAGALLLVLTIFVWTPPHFWALAIHRVKDYSKADVPMLPVTHGIRYTKIQILLYTLLLMAVTLLPYAINMSGLIYFIGVIIINLRFLYWAIKLLRSDDDVIAMKTFKYSIYYLGLLFMFLLIDHYFFY